MIVSIYFKLNDDKLQIEMQRKKTISLFVQDTVMCIVHTFKNMFAKAQC